jgi:ABC-type transport system substrate-binding protein
MRRDLKKVNIELNLKPLDRVAATSAYYTEQWNGLYAKGAGSSRSLDAGGFLESVRTGGADNGGKLTDPKIDELYAKIKATYKPEDQYKLVKDLEDYIVKQQVAFALQLPDRFALSLWRKHMHNFIDNSAWWIGGGGGQQHVTSWLDDKVPNRNIDSF